MSRTMLRTLSTTASTLLLLVLTALPALAASGTKPDPDENPFLIGSLEQLIPTAIVGFVVALIAWSLLPSRSAAEDEHH